MLCYTAVRHREKHVSTNVSTFLSTTGEIISGGFVRGDFVLDWTAAAVAIVA